MSINLNKLEESLMRHEGNVPYVYDDHDGSPITPGYTVIGHPTIGIGRLLTKDRGLSYDERKYLLSNDIQSSLREAQAQPWWANVRDDDVRARALVEMVFNLGISRFRGFERAISHLLNSEFTNAAKEFLDSKWSAQVGNRANVLAKMIETGEDV